MKNSDPVLLDDALIKALSRVSLFAGLTRLQVIWLLHAMTRVSIKSGDLFFDEGDHADCLYVFIAGEAVVEKKNSTGWRTLATLQPSETFGEMAIVDRLPRSARVRAIKDCIALSLNSARLNGSAEIAVEIFRNIAALQTKRLRKMNQAELV
jgi:CRP/FNR family cyclic AMP-dependent transcriptional regulator